MLSRIGMIAICGWLLAAGWCWAEETTEAAAASDEAAVTVMPPKRSYGNVRVQKMFERQVRQRTNASGRELETEPMMDADPAPRPAPTPVPTSSLPKSARIVRSYGYKPEKIAVFEAVPSSYPVLQDPQIKTPEHELKTEPIMEEEETSRQHAGKMLRFQARLDRLQIHLDESFSLIVEAQISEPKQLGPFQVLNMPNFKLINKTQTQTNMASGQQGYWVRTKEYVYIGTNPGEYTIPSIRVVYAGQEFSTLPLQISVVGSRTGQGFSHPFSGNTYRAGAYVPGDPETRSEKNEVRFVAQISQPQAYINQMVVVSIRLKYTQNDQTSVSYRPPHFNNFLTESMAEQKSEEVVLGGKQRYLDRTYHMALFPVQAGLLVVEPAEAVITVKGINNSYITEAMNLKVLPLPADPENAEYPGGNGLVGEFVLQADWEEPTVETDSPWRLRFTLRGEGNIRSAPEPIILEQAEYKLYLEGKTESIRPDYESLHGERQYQYLVVFKKTGTYNLGIARIRYFNPRQKSWKTAQVQLPAVQVRSRVTQRLLEIGDTRVVKLSLRANRFRPGRLKKSVPWAPMTLGFWEIQAAGPALLGLLVLGRRWEKQINADPVAARRRRAYANARRSLRQLRRYIRRREDKKFYEELSRTTIEYLAAKFSLPNAYIGPERLPDYFEQHHVPNLLRTRFRAALTACEYVRFAATVLPSKDMQSLHQDLRIAIREFEKFLKEKNRVISVGEKTAFLFLVLVSMVTAGYAGEAEVVFLQANGYAEKQEYAAAEAGYRKLLSMNVEDSLVYYNLGNVCLAQKKIGPAVLAYERGLQLAPRDQDLRTNRAQAALFAWQETEAVHNPGWVNGAVGIYQAFTPNELIWLAAGLYSGVLGLSIAWWVWPKSMPGAKPVRGLGIALLVLLVVWSSARYCEPVWRRRAVVMTATTQVFNRPYSQADVINTLPEGTIVSIKQDEQAWVEVIFGVRRNGWIQRSTVSFIE